VCVKERESECVYTHNGITCRQKNGRGWLRLKVACSGELRDRLKGKGERVCVCVRACACEGLPKFRKLCENVKKRERERI
jgi:hypothetical protein